MANSRGNQSQQKTINYITNFVKEREHCLLHLTVKRQLVSTFKQERRGEEKRQPAHTPYLIKKVCAYVYPAEMTFYTQGDACDCQGDE